MKVFLLHRDRDFDVHPALRDAMFDAMTSGHLFAMTNLRREHDRARRSDPAELTGQFAVLAQDLELETLWKAMAAGDEYLYETVKRGVLSSLHDPDAIVYRQHVLADCLEHPEIVRNMYDLALEALDNERKAGRVWHGDRPASILDRCRQVLALHVDVIRRLRGVAEEHAEDFASDGFTRFFAMLEGELGDDYLQTVEHHLGELEFKRGLLESATLGKGSKGRRYTVRTLPHRRWTERLPFANRSPSLSFTIPARDEAGFQALEDIRDKGLNEVANVVAQSADHVKSFFSMLRLELAFYLGCINLHDRLGAKGEPTCMPTAVSVRGSARDATGLYDVSLSLHLESRAVGNELHADRKPLVIITGANQGGKSTLLRSIGLAQLMMQAGMFVGAESFRAAVRSAVFTHYKREEDAEMESGKLDEELRRMSAIADEITPGSLLLCNESFASTNEREGSEIARQVVRAMLETGIDVVFVTHMYDLAHGFHEQQLDTALFLRAERADDGHRSFKLREGEPLPTSYGEDSYRRIFGPAEHQPAPS
jgi:hypothetical protein